MDPDRLKGKNILITGAARGMGAANAEAFAAQGANVCIADLDGDAAQEMADAPSSGEAGRQGGLHASVSFAKGVEPEGGARSTERRGDAGKASIDGQRRLFLPVVVLRHPLAIVGVSDHFTRVKMGGGCDCGACVCACVRSCRSPRARAAAGRPS